MNAKARKRKREREKKQQEEADESNKLAVNAPAPHKKAILPKVAAISAASAAPRKKFLTPQDGPSYDQLIKEHYRGFSMVPGTDVDPQFHLSSRLALEKLRDSSYYQYDMVMAGKNLSRTFVQRTLVGNPGITYKYLGLRLFAHAWSGPSALPAFREIYTLNQEMVRLTKVEQQKASTNNANVDSVVAGKGSCEYNLTLINYMEPANERSPLKEEEQYGLGKTSVSWHADSSLQDYSSIGVYHTLPTQRNTKWDWKIALRVTPEENTKSSSSTAIQPVVVPTKSGDLYFLMGDFNHGHQHMVLAGSTTHRISSTHRVAVVEKDTYDYIKNRVSKALVSTKSELQSQEKHKPGKHWNLSVILECQAALTELEFEWIAQYWVQGAQHDALRAYWQAPMRALEQAWASLEKCTFKIYRACIEDLSSSSASSGDSALVAQGLVVALQERHELRQAWDLRRADKIYKRRIARPYQPVERPLFDNADSKSMKKRLPKDLGDAIASLVAALEKTKAVTIKDDAVKAKLATQPPQATQQQRRQHTVKNKKKKKLRK